MIELPPKVKFEDVIEVMLKEDDKAISELVESINSKYEYWSDVKYKKIPDSITHTELWTRVKASRLKTQINVWDKYNIHFSMTNTMQKMCHEFDMSFGGSWGAESIIPIENREMYLINSLMEEAFSSSQMEGASTTRKKAKEMLRKKMSPKDKSQQMIFNNYQTIRFIVENRDKPLCEELLLKIHSLMTQDTLDSSKDVGRLRTDDEVVVENAITHEIVHTPPSYVEMKEFIESLCEFFNSSKTELFTHPIIKGIIIHFMIAYIHPFVDGNGRTARALFYWYLLKNGYWLTEYLSISRVISRSKIKYENVFLYSENDDNDIGYFITYNLNVMNSAFKDLQKYIKRKIEEKEKTNLFLKIGNINQRQAGIIKIFNDNPREVLTVKDVEGEFNVVAATAKRDIVGLLERGIVVEISFNKVKKGYIRSDNFEELVLP